MRLNLMRRSLHWRIALPYALLILVLMGGVTLFLYFTLRSFYTQQMGDRLLAEARLASQDIGTLVAQNPDPGLLNKEVIQASRAVGGRVTLIRADGVVIAESERPVDGMENHLGRPEVQVALEGKDALQVRYSNTFQMDLMYAAVPVGAVDPAGKPLAVMRVAYPLGEIQRTINKLVGSILLTTAIAALLAIFMAIWIARYTLRPLRALSQSVERASAGLLPEVTSPEGVDEISELQTAFHSMYAQLNDRFEELRRERGKLEAMLMNMNDAILIVNSESRVELINQAAHRLFNLSDDIERAPSLAEVVRHHQVVEMWRQSLLTNQPQSASMETAMGRSNLQAVATPLKGDMEGSVLLAFQDLTRVRRLETVRQDFISNVSHELRTPLASLKALTETLQEGALEDPPAARRFLSQMENEVDNLTQMVRELLELSRIESGKVPVVANSVSAAQLVSHAGERMRLQAERGGLNFHIQDEDPVGSSPLVMADAERIDQVLINLIHNAVKFTQPGGSIEVGWEPRGGEVVFFVRDTGVGIAPEEQGRIFERFYKADRSRSGGGTGLGLSIARHVVETHGGRIWLESQVDQGSTFYFSLPAAANG